MAKESLWEVCNGICSDKMLLVNPFQQNCLFDVKRAFIRLMPDYSQQVAIK